MRIFEDEHIYALWLEGDCRRLVISFSNAITVPDGVRCFADTPARKTETACLGVVSKRPDWFCPADSIHALAISARRRLAPFRTRIAYGSSMGGYGALKFSRLFGATHVLAMSPQWSIDPADAPGGRNLGWSENIIPDMRGMSVKAEDISGEVFAFVDPADELDWFHATQIRSAYPAARIVPVYGSGHHVGSVLATTEFFRAAIAGALAGDVGGLTAAANRIRRRNGFKVEVIAKRAMDRHALWAAHVLLKTAIVDPPQRPNVRHYFFPIFSALVTQIGWPRAIALAQSFEPFFAGSDREEEFRATTTPRDVAAA